MRSSLIKLSIRVAIIVTYSAAMADEQKAPHTLPALKVLPVGSTLHDLRIPQFNKDYETTSVLFAKQMDILEKQKLKGTKVNLTVYKDNHPQATTLLNTAFYQESTGIIHSVENLTISGDSFDIAAQGLILHWEKRTGFLLGKTQTLFYSDIDKKMTSHVSTPKNKKSASTVNTKTKLISKPKVKPTAVIASAVTIPALLSAEELKEIDTLTASSTPVIQQVDKQAKKDIQQMQDVASSINHSKNILHGQLISTVGNEVTPNTAAVSLKPQADKVPVTVNCENGMYFDAITGTVVYQKDVIVIHPKYKLTCSDELKIILKEKTDLAKPTTPQPTEGETITPNTQNLARFSGLSKGIATGNVVIKSKDKDGKIIVTHSETATYDGDTGIIILSGGRPTVEQGDTIARVLSDTGYIKILPNMSVRIEGRHEIKANLNELQDKG
ncbi:MAG: hypothetical protein ABGY95_08550 [Rubritalea sp.]|uniref:LptA/OstA family protein n=1 Tax=Rubritalea sp. TaxID=2109375 RepID=UPI003241E372